MKKTILFDEKSCRWEENKLVNGLVVGIYECRLNDNFQLYGYLLLRDVYEALGIPITKESLVAGWIKGENHKKFEYEIHENPDGTIDIVLPDMESDIRYAFPLEES
jgi:hypothetical protein